MLKEGKPFCTPMKEKCNAIIDMKLPKSVQELCLLYGMLNILSLFLKDLRNFLSPRYKELLYNILSDRIIFTNM